MFSKIFKKILFLYECCEKSCLEEHIKILPAQNESAEKYDVFYRYGIIFSSRQIIMFRSDFFFAFTALRIFLPALDCPQS